MNKPQQKREVAVVGCARSIGMINIFASRDAVEDFASFGRIDQFGGRYTLWVDGRFDFDEVLEYITGYDAQDTARGDEVTR